MYNLKNLALVKILDLCFANTFRSATGIALFLIAFPSYSNLCAFDGTESKSQENSTTKTIDKEQLFKDLEKKLTGSVMKGTFTIDGRNNSLREEKYSIESLTKVDNQDSKWKFVARIQYGKNDVKIPMFLDIFWANDTPVISLTDMSFPGLGTFTARVMIYENHYCGYWKHDKVTGHMFGHILSESKQD